MAAPALSASIKEEVKELTALTPAISSSLTEYALTYGRMASEKRSQVQRDAKMTDDIASDLQSKAHEGGRRCGLPADVVSPVDDNAETIHKWAKAVKDDDVLTLRKLFNMN